MLIPQAFGNYIFLLDEEKSIKQDFFHRAANWFSDNQTWYLGINQVLSGRNLNYLYDRGISVLGYGVLDHYQEVKELASAAVQHGCTFACELFLIDCIEQPEVYEELLDEGLMKTLLFNPSGSDEVSWDEIRSMVEAAATKGVSLIFEGEPLFWRNSGLLDSEIINGNNFRLIPVKDVSNQFASKPEQIHLAAGVPLPPCQSNFAIYITPDGDLYPCIGMMDVVQYRLGSIYDPADQTMLNLEENRLTLQQLNDQGPKLKPGNYALDYPYLPVYCQAHRQSLIN